MKLRASTILGLALADRRIACAQVKVGGDRPRVQRVAHFDLPADVSLAQPEALGKLLGAFLKAQQFSASHAVVGVPARWLIAQERELPPSSPQEGMSVLRLQAERIALSDNKSLTFDVVGQADPGGPSRVLLVGILQEQLDAIVRMCAAARLKLNGVTSTALAIAAGQGAPRDGMIVIVAPHGAEVVAQRRGAPRALKHLALASASTPYLVGALGGELRRILATLAGDDGGGVLLWDELGLSAQDMSDLSGRLERSVHSAASTRSALTDSDVALVNGSADPAGRQSCLAAVALAHAWASRAGELPVDFLHPRLASPQASRFNRTTLLAIAAGVLVAALLISLYASVLSMESQAASLNARLGEMQPDIAAAEARINRTIHARGYYQTRPAVLDCLRELTRAFGPAEPIWATSITLRENHRGQLQGRATEQRIVLTVRDRLMANPRFADVQLQDLRDAGGNTREVAFSISFRFVQEGAAP
jgi:hypothetical protein